MDTAMDLCSSDGDDNDCFDDPMATMEDNSQSGCTSSDPCQGFGTLETPSGDDSCSDSNSRRHLGGTGPSAKMVDVAGPYSIYSCDHQDDGCIRIDAIPNPGGQFAFPARSHLGEGNTNRMCPQISAPELKQMGMKRGRDCPMCKEDVSWLPQIAACPHCGYKPLPIFEEKVYNEDATANDILVDFFENLGPDFDSVSGCPNAGENQQPSDMKTEEAFEAIVQDYTALKHSIKKCHSAQPCASAAKPPPKKSATDLFTIFTELKKICGGADADADKKNKIKEICQEACKLAKVSKKRIGSKSPSKISDCCAELKRRHKQKKAHGSPWNSRLYGPVETLNHPRKGHAHCYEYESKVPAHMGWLWTHNPLAQHPGWRPGAIRRSIRVLMGYFLKDFPVDSMPISKYKSYHNQKPAKPDNHSEKPEDLVQVPTLHIEKKNDEYIITLRPLKDAASLKRAANPYAKMKPVQFRIVKNPQLKQVREMKRCLKKMGFSKCTCHRPVMRCYCRSFVDKKLLVDEVQRQCREREMVNCENELVLSDTTDSEAEFDFGVTPPAGLMKPERLKTTDVTHQESQYNENDWAMPTMYPHPPNANVQYGGCVMGERKGRFPWIFGKGYVHRKPKPPIMRNPPKKKPKRAFPGAPLSREKGGHNSNAPIQPFTENPLYDDRQQRLNRAAYPPTTKQFQQQQKQTVVKKVHFAEEND
ncbi:uncharacterized protein LOC122322513 [Drosophila grimshawi]|uniref:uncharacterized protein LOC122322513 n=1 Tax=Drosophila grimshawi TaxID=7222 RepID=UPI001C93299B|nr:uncharacterized protein LOC122322513 [Drosophila grimshawi]